MIRKKKKYSRPQRPFDKARIEAENVLKDKYGLKNKKEIWKADAAIGRIRNQAKELITKSDEEKNAFVEKLHKKGFGVKSVADSLALDKEDWLKRRLQTILKKKGLTTTTKQARQLITHKHVSIGDQIVNIPSYQVSLEEEGLVKLNITLKTDKKPKTKVEKIKEELEEEKQKVKEEPEVSKEPKEENKAEEVNGEKKE
ncbi:MAG: 30S ribosomal protein S4 [archaeon]